MAISIRDAMNTLQNMFPFIEREVIASVLQAHNGHLEATVTTLLEMGKPKQVIQPTYAIRTTPQIRNSSTSIPNNSEITGSTNLPNGGVSMGTPMGTVIQRPPQNQRQSQQQKNENYNRTVLPDDFLRPPSYFKTAKRNVQQEHEDALLAQMLQDEWFVRDLQQNPQRYGLPPQQPIYYGVPTQQQAPRVQQRPPTMPTAMPVPTSGMPTNSIPPTSTSTTPATASSTASTASSASSQSSQSQSSSLSDSTLSTPLIGASDDPIPVQRGTPGETAQGSDEASWADKFSKLGENARKKLALFAAKLQKKEDQKQTSDNVYKELPSMDDEVPDEGEEGGVKKKKVYYEMKEFAKKKKEKEDDDEDYGTSSYISLPEGQTSINSGATYGRVVTSSST